jgi:hypothetical protein
MTTVIEGAISSAMTEREKVARRDHMRDMAVACRMGQSLEEYRAERDAKIEAWTQFAGANGQASSAFPVQP